MTLIELMISMMLGLIVIGGVVSVVLAGKQSYRTNEALSQVQESARTAFELMARDIRQAGVNGCGNNDRVANVLRPQALLPWWQSWFGIRGYDGAADDLAATFGTDAGERWNGTDSIQLQGIEGMGLSIEAQNNQSNSANFKINAPSTDLIDNDIVMVCDFDHSTILQVTNYNSSTRTTVHNTNQGAGTTPGNCSKGLGYPTECTPNGNAYSFGPNSQIARFTAVNWYIGANGRTDDSGRSLYRIRLARGAVPTEEEIVAGVTDMQITYHRTNTTDFVPAATVTADGNWDTVTAVTITLTLDSADRRVTTDTNVNSGRLQRSFTHLVTLRNRVP